MTSHVYCWIQEFDIKYRISVVEVTIREKAFVVRNHSKRLFSIPKINWSIQGLWGTLKRWHCWKNAINNKCSRFILISSDSDLVPAVKAVKLIDPNKKVIVYVPANNKVHGAANELRNSSDGHKTLPNNLFSKAQFPDQLTDPKGEIIW